MKTYFFLFTCTATRRYKDTLTLRSVYHSTRTVNENVEKSNRTAHFIEDFNV